MLAAKGRSEWLVFRGAATARRVAGELDGLSAWPQTMIDAYVRGHGDGDPWYMLDQRHRHLEHRWATFDVGLDGSHDTLARVVQLARNEYHAAVARLGIAFTDALTGTRFEIADVLPQRTIFPRVRRQMSKGKTAYLLVDALRYEMGRELIDGLGEGFERWPRHDFDRSAGTGFGLCGIGR